MPYITPSPASSPPLVNGHLPSPSTSSIAFRLGSSDSLPTLSSQCSSSSNSDEDRLSPHSSPPTPETGLPSSATSSPTSDKKLAIPAQTRPFRNHIRSHSHDAIASMHALRTHRRDSSDSAASTSSSLIYLHPASPPVRNSDGILISNPVTTETSPRTKNKLSLFDLRSPEGTEWPEGESTEVSDDQQVDEASAWTPPTELPPSTSFSFGVGPSSSSYSSASTPTPRSAMKQPRRNLRIDIDPANDGTVGASPLPTPMVRKKSGELVRSSLKQNHSTTSLASLSSTRSVRAKSAPTTPIGPKAVHFSQELEQVKLFLAQQRPTAVSRQGSPGETTEDDSEAYPFPVMTSITGRISLLLNNFPNPVTSCASGHAVFLQSLELLQDSKMLRGVIAVKNISFHKRVVVRFTTDDWQTISEVAAEYQQAIENGLYDQWVFRIKLADMLARIEDKKMLLAIKYTVDSHDIWDNNNDQNYLVQFKKEAPSKVVQTAAERKASKYQWSVTTAGQASERMADLRKVLDRLVQEDKVEVSASGPPKDRSLANRYDFGASLKQHPGRTASADSLPMLKDIKQPFFHPITTSSIIGGMPATTLLEPTAQPRYARQEFDGAYNADYGMPTHLIYAGQKTAQPFPLQGPGSPPRDDKLSLQHDEAMTRTERFNSFPPNRWDSTSSAASTPRLYQDTFSPPSFSRSAGSEARQISPAVSPRSASPDRQSAFANGRRPRSPPPAISSPDFSTPSSSNDSSYDSPRSPARSYSPDEEQPSYMALPKKDDSGQTYSSFLDKYCFFSPRQNTLGLTDVPSTSYFPPADVLTTPRACSTAYMQGSNSTSSDSTPPHGSPLII